MASLFDNRARQLVLNIIQRFVNLGHDESIGIALIDIRHVPIKYRTIFFHQLSNVRDN